MTLREYLDREKIPTKDAAAALGCSAVHMSGVITGVRPASEILKRLIWYWSKEAVGLEDWPDYAPTITPGPSYRSREPERRRRAAG